MEEKYSDRSGSNEARLFGIKGKPGKKGFIAFL